MENFYIEYGKVAVLVGLSLIVILITFLLCRLYDKIRMKLAKRREEKRDKVFQFKIIRGAHDNGHTISFDKTYLDEEFITAKNFRDALYKFCSVYTPISNVYIESVRRVECLY